MHQNIFTIIYLGVVNTTGHLFYIIYAICF